MGQEAGSQGADLAAGEVQALLPSERVADLLALTMLQKAQAADAHLDVIAIGAPRGNEPGQLCGATGQRAPGGPPAATRAGQHGLAGADGAVGQRDHAPLYRLLHQHPAPTARAGSARGLGGSTHLAQRVQRLLPSDLQREHLPA